jgi:adenylate cyclase
MRSDRNETPSAYYFEGFALDLAKGRLLGPEGNEVPLRPKAFDLLGILAGNPGRTLAKSELLDLVWGEIHVTEDSLFQAVREARRALDDKAGQLLRSVPRRGYILDCAVQIAGEPAATQPSPSEALQPASDRTSVAVLPFRMLGDGQARGYFTDGLVEEITTALSRFRWLFVSASRSAAQLRHAEGGLAETGRLLGVRYLVDGSITYAAEQLRINCRLIEAAGERTVWSDRFAGNTADIFRLQDEITSAIAAALEPRILRAEIERVLRQATTSLDAFDCYLRALPGYHSRTPRGNSNAVVLLEAALALDPHFQLARALLARCVATAVWLGTERDHDAGSRRSLQLAREALAGDRADAHVLALCGHLLAVVGGEHDEASALLDLSLRMNPNGAEAWRLGAWVSVWCGALDQALSRLDEAERLDPLSPLQADLHAVRAAALFYSGRYSEAAAVARRSLASVPEATTPRRYLTAALVRMEALSEARSELAELLRLQPNSSIRRTRAMHPLRDTAMLDLYLDTLRQAGMPE